MKRYYNAAHSLIENDESFLDLYLLRKHFSDVDFLNNSFIIENNGIDHNYIPPCKSNFRFNQNWCTNFTKKSNLNFKVPGSLKPHSYEDIQVDCLNFISKLYILILTGLIPIKYLKNMDETSFNLFNTPTRSLGIINEPLHHKVVPYYKDRITSFLSIGIFGELLPTLLVLKSASEIKCTQYNIIDPEDHSDNKKLHNLDELITDKDYDKGELPSPSKELDVMSLLKKVLSSEKSTLSDKNIFLKFINETLVTRSLPHKISSPKPTKPKNVSISPQTRKKIHLSDFTKSKI